MAPDVPPRRDDDPVPEPSESSRLLRAIDELRALELERRTASDHSVDDLERRVELKAREVFRIAEGDDELGPPTA